PSATAVTHSANLREQPVVHLRRGACSRENLDRIRLRRNQARKRQRKQSVLESTRPTHDVPSRPKAAHGSAWFVRNHSACGRKPPAASQERAVMTPDPELSAKSAEISILARQRSDRRKLTPRGLPRGRLHPSARSRRPAVATTSTARFIRHRQPAAPWRTCAFGGGKARAKAFGPARPRQEWRTRFHSASAPPSPPRAGRLPDAPGRRRRGTPRPTEGSAHWARTRRRDSCRRRQSAARSATRRQAPRARPDAPPTR